MLVSNSGSCTGDMALLVLMHIMLVASLVLLGDDVAVSRVKVAVPIDIAVVAVACVAVALLLFSCYFLLALFALSWT